MSTLLGRLDADDMHHPRSLDPTKASSKTSDPLVASARLYHQHHPDVEIHWDKRTLQQFEAFPVDDLAALYDLLMIDYPFIGAAAAKASLVPLDTLLPADFLSQQATQSVGPSYQSYGYGGHQWALAADAAAQVTAYRADLLAELPADWSAVLELAAGRSQPEGAQVGVPLLPAHAVCSFFTLCANWGEPACQKGDMAVSPDTGRRVLIWMHDLVGVLHPSSLRSDPPALLERMAQTDEIAYVPLIFGYVSYARPGFRSHPVRFADIPSGGSGPVGGVLGGVGIAVSAHCPHLLEAAAYLRWLMEPDVQRGLYFEAGGQPGNRVAWEDPAVNDQCSRFFLDTLQTLDRAYVRPRYDGFIRFQEEAGKLIHRFLQHGGEPEDVLDPLNALYRDRRL